MLERLQKWSLGVCLFPNSIQKQAEWCRQLRKEKKQSCKNSTKVRKERTISAWTPGSQGLFVILTNLLLSIILTLTPSSWCMDKFTLVKGDSFSWNLFNFCQTNVIHALSKLQQWLYGLPRTAQVNTWQEWKIAMMSKKNSFKVWRPP